MSKLYSTIVVSIIVLLYSSLAYSKTAPPAEVSEKAAKAHADCKNETLDTEIRVKACIDEARLTRSESLTLEKMDIDTIPEEVFELDFLVKLDASYTNIHSLPKGLARLKNLEKLTLFECKFRELPKIVFSLPKLRYLEMYGNQITRVEKVNESDDLSALESLVVINLAGNQFTDFPPVFFGLKKIDTFRIGGNITQLPENIGDLAMIQHLDVSDNKLTELPDSIGKLREAHTLSLNGNRITRLPETFGDLHMLSSLYLSDNRLDRLPDSFGKLQMLAYLDIYDNAFDHFPEVLCELNTLDTLFFGRRGTAPVLPDSFRNLSNLDMLSPKVDQYKEIPEVLFHAPRGLMLLMGDEEMIRNLPKEQIERLKAKRIFLSPTPVK
jgi:hypothetical protein